MARFGTEMACFRFMLNSDISLITLFTIYYNVTKKHRGNGGRNDAGIMKDTGAGTLQAGAVLGEAACGLGVFLRIAIMNIINMTW